MLWGYHYFRKHPFTRLYIQKVVVFLGISEASTAIIGKIHDSDLQTFPPSREAAFEFRRLRSKEGNTIDTPWKFNIAPENGWLEDEFPFGIPYFQGLC